MTGQNGKKCMNRLGSLQHKAFVQGYKFIERLSVNLVWYTFNLQKKPRDTDIIIGTLLNDLNKLSRVPAMPDNF